jgi:hypothetical protein
MLRTVSTPPKTPTGLAAAGKALWKRIVSDLPGTLEFDQRDLVVLGRAAKLSDRIAEADKAVERDSAVQTRTACDECGQSAPAGLASSGPRG